MVRNQTKRSPGLKKALTDLTMLPAALIIADVLALMTSSASVSDILAMNVRAVIPFFSSAVLMAVFYMISGKIFDLRPEHLAYGILFSGWAVLFRNGVPAVSRGAVEPNLPEEIHIILFSCLYMVAVVLIQTAGERFSDMKADITEKEAASLFVLMAAVIAASAMLHFENSAYSDIVRDICLMLTVPGAFMAMAGFILYRTKPTPRALGFLPLASLIVTAAAAVGTSVIHHQWPGGILTGEAAHYPALFIASVLFVCLIRAAEKTGRRLTGQDEENRRPRRR